MECSFARPAEFDACRQHAGGRGGRRRGRSRWCLPTRSADRVLVSPTLGAGSGRPKSFSGGPGDLPDLAADPSTVGGDQAVPNPSGPVESAEPEAEESSQCEGPFHGLLKRRP